MRPLLTLLLTLSCVFGYSQKSKTDSLLAYTTSSGQTIRKDSFVFGSRTYPLPRDCDREDQSNCCSYTSNPDQMACYNGTGLSWDYRPSAEAAALNMESWVSQMEQQMKTFTKERVTCYLLGKEVTGYAMRGETKANLVWHTIIVSGEADGKAMVVQLHTPKKLQRNEELQPVFRQILSLKQ